MLIGLSVMSQASMERNVNVVNLRCSTHIHMKVAFRKKVTRAKASIKCLIWKEYFENWTAKHYGKAFNMISCQDKGVQLVEHSGSTLTFLLQLMANRIVSLHPGIFSRWIVIHK